MKKYTCCKERNAEIVTSTLEGNAESIDDQLVSVVQEGKVEAFVYSAEQNHQPEDSSCLEDGIWLLGNQREILKLRLSLRLPISFSMRFLTSNALPTHILLTTCLHGLNLLL